MSCGAKKVTIVGLDGGTFEVLQPLIDEGRLPNFKKLQEEGIWGDLTSVVPPATPQAWSSFATGCNPGKHGVFGFFDNVTNSFVSARSIKAKTLWEILSAKGRKVAVMNVPLTYPTTPVNGVMVSGLMTPDESCDYTYPVDLKREILEKFPDYVCNPYHDLACYKEAEVLSLIPKQVGLTESVNQHLLSKDNWDFSISVFRAPDFLQHMYWHYVDPNLNGKRDKALKELAFQTYVSIDEVIGRRLEQADEDTVIIVMSDHGFGLVEGVIYLDVWLRDHGLLKTKAFGLDSLKLWLRKILAGSRRFMVERGMPDVFQQMKVSTREKLLQLTNTDIVLSKTKAFTAYADRPHWVANSDWGIQINVSDRSPHGIVQPGKEYEELRRYIVEELSKLSDPRTGERVFDIVCPREEIYSGPLTNNANDIILMPKGMRYFVSRSLISNKVVIRTEQEEKGSHRLNGMVALWGNGIRHGERLVEANIMDLAPTILYLMGLAVPGEMDGRVLSEAIEKDYLNSHPVNYTAEKSAEGVVETADPFSDEEREKIRNSLRGLGYID